jgi:hypothetical protein
MKGRKKRGRAGRSARRQEREVLDGYDNFIIVEERLPSDYWALREAREEYCKEYGC